MIILWNIIFMSKISGTYNFVKSVNDHIISVKQGGIVILLSAPIFFLRFEILVLFFIKTLIVFIYYI